METSARVLVVENNAAIRDSLIGSLADAGYTVHALPDGAGLEAELERFRPDAVIVDWMLPDRNGPTLARVVAARSRAPVILLTAWDEVTHLLRGFEAGVGDYLTKPFAVADLAARLRVVLRRTGATSTVVQVDDLLVGPAAASVTRAGQRLKLTATELRLLTFLAEHHDRMLSPTHILAQVWGYHNYAGNLVQVHVCALRRKLEAHGHRLLHTVRGVGYVLRAPA